MPQYTALDTGTIWEIHRAGCADITRKKNQLGEGSYYSYDLEAVNGLDALNQILEDWADMDFNGETREERLQYIKLINCAV